MDNGLASRVGAKVPEERPKRELQDILAMRRNPETSGKTATREVETGQSNACCFHSRSNDPALVDNRLGATWKFHFVTRWLSTGLRTDEIRLTPDEDVKTAMIYAHVLNRGWLAVRSPLD